MRQVFTALLLLPGLALSFCTAHAQSLRVVGAPTVSLPLLDAADILKKEKNLALEISTEGGSSSWGISALGLTDTDVAMSSRVVTAEDRAQFPGINFTEIYFGEMAAVLVVSQDVWDGGVRALTKAQAKGIYEGKIRNWKDVGGPDLTISGYSAEPGHAVWACYFQWIYEDATKVRPNRFSIANTDDEAKTDLESTPGSITEVSMPFAQSKKLHTLAIVGTDGNLIQPTTASINAHTYPMSRPLILVVRNRPLDNVRILAEFMLSDRGQDLLHKYNYITLKDLGATPQTFE
ncbi:MAG: substrate-binding domain-containing protein [Chthoniobacteraceae bacterium]